MTPELWQWLTMMALTVVAAMIVTRPWWRTGSGPVQARRAANVTTYRSRLAELAAEREAGLLKASDAESLEQELGARLLADTGEAVMPSSIDSGTAARRIWWPIAAATLSLIMFASLWYGLAGSWREQREIAKGSQSAAAVDPQVAAMIDQLAQKLRVEPDNPEGWAMLGRSYFATQRYADAARAYGEANQRQEVGGKTANSEWLVGQGEAIAFADGERIPPAAAALFERALKLTPDYDKALWYGGLAAAQDGRLPVARERWTTLLKTPGLPEPMRAALQERLQAIDGVTAVDDAPASSTAVSAVSLQIRVSLSPALAAQVPAGATLFVFAKAASGPPMPLAVQRLPGAKLPQQLTLDDSMAMAPQLKLSQFARYVVTARLSKSGGAQPQSGDLQGSVEVDRNAADVPVNLSIDTVLP